MSRVIIFGSTGNLGRHVLRQALAAGEQVTVSVRDPLRLPPEARDRVTIHQGDLMKQSHAGIARLIHGHDALINCAGGVAEGQPFVDLVGRLVAAAMSLQVTARPVCWFLAGAALLDIDSSGRKGVELPKVRSTYWPHRINFESISTSSLDWRILCPGPMVEGPALGLQKLRISQDILPVSMPGFAHVLPSPVLLPLFAYRIPEMIVPYADAATMMLSHLSPGDASSRHRIGLALPLGMRGSKPRWTAQASSAS